MEVGSFVTWCIGSPCSGVGLTSKSLSKTLHVSRLAAEIPQPKARCDGGPRFLSKRVRLESIEPPVLDVQKEPDRLFSEHREDVAQHDSISRRRDRLIVLGQLEVRHETQGIQFSGAHEG